LGAAAKPPPPNPHYLPFPSPGLWPGEGKGLGEGEVGGYDNYCTRNGGFGEAADGLLLLWYRSLGGNNAHEGFPDDRLGCIMYDDYSGYSVSLFGWGRNVGVKAERLESSHPVPAPIG